MMVFEDFGKNVRKYREKLGLSQERLGELINVSTNSVSSWESGKSFAKPHNLKALVKLFGITESKLIGINIDSDENYNCSYIEQIIKICENLSDEQLKHILRIIKTF